MGVVKPKRGRHRATPPLRPRLRRAAVVFVASFSAMLGVSAAGVAEPPRAVVDLRFLTDLRERGHVVAPGTDEELIISAGRKLCVLIDGQTSRQRRSILTSAEVDAIRRSFGADPQGFIKLATRTYC